MDSNKSIFREKMLNVLSAEPISTIGKNALTALNIHISEHDFLKDVYVEPFTSSQYPPIESPNELADPDVGYSTAIEFNSLISTKEAFELHLKGLKDSLFVIKGGAGSGKTTYAHHLEQECKNIKFIFCDFEKANKSISLFRIPYDFEKKYKSNVWKFVSIIAEQISSILFGTVGPDDFGTFKNYIQTIVRVYNEYFDISNPNYPIVDEIAMWDFFSVLKTFSTSDHQDVENFQKQLRNCLVCKFEEFEKADLKQDAVVYVCEILIRIFLCLNRMYGKKYVCGIDNIEYFVPFDKDHPIQDCELQIILNGVSTAINQIRPTIQKWKEVFPGYETFYGFLLVTRDTTASFVEYWQFDDFGQEREIDITKWFSASDIYKKKTKYFGEILKGLIGNPYFEAYGNIFDDISQFNWGMHDILCKMYNYNYRRIMINVVNALADQPEKVIEWFNARWDECCKDRTLQCSRHLCRKFILRIMFDYIQRKSYFKNLLVEDRPWSTRMKKPDNIKSSYARKISTTLHRVSLCGIEYLTFPQLITAILKPPHLVDQPTDEEIEDLASILFLMNETRNNKTHWAPLIMIKFDTEEIYTKQNLIAEMLWQWKAPDSDSKNQRVNKYGVRITEAGSFFAKILPDFEYFACRYVPQYPALLVRENLKATSGGASYQCLDIIKIVRNSAFQCIDEVIEWENTFFKSMGGSSQLPNRFSLLYNTKSMYKWIYFPNASSISFTHHPLRILHHQIGYLQHYLEYVEALTEDSFYSQGDQEKIAKGLQTEIANYKHKLEEILRQNSDYFNVKPDNKSLSST